MSVQTDIKGRRLTGEEPKPRKSIGLLWRAFNVRKNEELDARDAASTLFPFFRSNHVLDLNLIFNVALVVLLLQIFLTVIAIIMGTPAVAAIASAGAAAAISIYGGILAWTYLTASKRLGVVDLFACEIATVCRLGTIVDVGRMYVEKLKRMKATDAIAAPSAHSSDFVSKEDYFSIFGTNSEDLQALESLIVSHITEFYTYMKAVRDSLRRLAQIETAEEAKETMINIVYTPYLGYESGRKAIDGLIEFQPTRTENMIVILLTELECYPVLCEHFKGDKLRFRRLQLRQADYECLVPQILDQVNESHEGNETYWAPAQRMMEELQTRYDRALETVRRCTREAAT